MGQLFEQHKTNPIVFEIDGAPLYSAGVIYQQQQYLLLCAQHVQIAELSRALIAILKQSASFVKFGVVCCTAGAVLCILSLFRHSALVMKYMVDILFFLIWSN